VRAKAAAGEISADELRAVDDKLKRRIDETAQYVDMERLFLSSQRGFSSTHHGNKISEDDEIAKLR
jgi:hypothetical protein